MWPAMTMREMPQRVWRGRRKVVRLQRDLWLAQIALWPALVLSAIALSVGTWALWRRKSRAPQPDAAAPPTESGQASPARTW